MWCLGCDGWHVLERCPLDATYEQSQYIKRLEDELAAAQSQIALLRRLIARTSDELALEARAV